MGVMRRGPWEDWTTSPCRSAAALRFDSIRSNITAGTRAGATKFERIFCTGTTLLNENRFLGLRCRCGLLSLRRSGSKLLGAGKLRRPLGLRPDHLLERFVDAVFVRLAHAAGAHDADDLIVDNDRHAPWYSIRVRGGEITNFARDVAVPFGGIVEDSRGLVARE